jgi:hypothetical protein
MNIHTILDNFTISLSALLLPKSKFFRDSIESPTFSEHLQSINLQFPEIKQEGQYEVEAETLIGVLDAAFRIAQWKGKEYPSIIYHHGSVENPYERSFNSIFPVKKIDIPANLIVIRAPFNRSKKEYFASIKDLSNFVAMLSVSVKLIEQLIFYIRERGTSCVVISGLSLGGWVTNLHHTYFNSADYYKLLLAGAELAEVILNSIWERLTAPMAKENPEQVRNILNFDENFAKVDNSNVFPLLSLYDQIIRFERQKQCYDERLITVLEKGHITGSLTFEKLRRHILENLKNYKRGV